MKPLSLFMCLAAAVLLSGCETTNTDRYVAETITTAPGRGTMLRAFYNVNPDCSPNGVPKVMVLSPPVHGSVDIVEGSDFPKYAATDPRHKCNGRRVRKQAAFYRPKPGFSGIDQTKLKAIGNAGPDDLQYVTIRVRVTK